MKIDLLYFNGCPSWQKALENLQTLIAEEHLDVSIRLVEVNSDQEATTRKFLGSPSIQVDGVDFWPEERDTFSMSCRVYRTSEGLRGWPSIEMLRERIHELSNPGISRDASVQR
jgi:hypothetical protein